MQCTYFSLIYFKREAHNVFPSWLERLDVRFQCLAEQKSLTAHWQGFVEKLKHTNIHTHTHTRLYNYVQYTLLSRFPAAGIQAVKMALISICVNIRPTAFIDFQPVTDTHPQIHTLHTQQLFGVYRLHFIYALCSVRKKHLKCIYTGSFWTYTWVTLKVSALSLDYISRIDCLWHHSDHITHKQLYSAAGAGCGPHKDRTTRLFVNVCSRCICFHNVPMIRQALWH